MSVRGRRRRAVYLGAGGVASLIKSTRAGIKVNK